MTRKMTPREDRLEINHQFSSLDHFIKEYVSNISRSGVFVRSKDPLPVGTRVNLRFTVVADDLEVIEGVGEVVRVSQRPKGMGVVFVELTHHSAELVQKLIVRRMTSGTLAEDEELAATTIRMNPLEVARAISQGMPAEPEPSVLLKKRAATVPPPPPQGARKPRQQTLPPPPPKPKAKK